ncbi:MAG: helix-turn-helix transcriptional regulator [Planctomycetes bacterium]|nr:helix-turn-helix transcriptional regulator [Planctomycetota bacterium]
MEKASEAKTRLAHKASAPGNTIFVCRVRELRNELNLSLREVALILHMSAANIHRIERGSDVPLSTARRIAAAFGKTVDEIWSDKP